MPVKVHVGSYGTHPEDVVKPPRYKPAFEMQPRAVAGILHYDVDELVAEWSRVRIPDLFATVHVPYFKSYKTLDRQAVRFLENTRRIAKAMRTDVKVIYLTGVHNGHDVYTVLSNVEEVAGPVPTPKLGRYTGDPKDYLNALRRYGDVYPAVDWGDIYAYFVKRGMYDRRTLDTLATKFAYYSILAPERTEKVVFYVTPFTVSRSGKDRGRFGEASLVPLETQLALSVAVALKAQRRLLAEGRQTITNVAFIYIGVDKREKRPEVVREVALMLSDVYPLVRDYLREHNYKLNPHRLARIVERELGAKGIMKMRF